MENNYRDELVARIKEIGQDLIDRAESMVNEEVCAELTGFSIYVDVAVRDSIPSIEYTTSFVSKNTIKRYIEKEN